MKHRLKIFSTIIVVIISILLVIPQNLFAKVTEYWVDTSHWGTTREWVEEGHYSTSLDKRWVDTSYWVTQGHWENYTDTVWVDTSHWVESGYWDNYTYLEWVTGGHYAYGYISKWVDTSHYETRYETISTWVSCNKIFYYGTTSYGWNVYKFAAKYEGNFEGTINGTRYRYRKYVIDYRPSYGGRVYAIKYECYQELKQVQTSYRVWVSEGHWETTMERYWVDTSHWETRTGRRWIDTSQWVEEGHHETKTGRRWVDTSYYVSEGHWEYYKETTWIDISHWEYNDQWIEDGYWVTADISLEGRVMHTLQWDKNRIQYNLSKTGTEDSPRGYEVFFNGEKFVLNAYATGEFEPVAVHVEFLGTGFGTDLNNCGESKWEGFIWDASFINFTSRDCVFKFTASYANGIVLEDDVTVYIVRDDYWRLHRGF